MLRARTPDKRRPGHIPGKNPGPSACSRGMKSRLRFLYARKPRRCPARVRECDGGGRGAELSALQLPGAARSRCASAGAATAATSTAPGTCARERRRESVRRAGARYQLSYRGACRHAARQRRWRARRAQKVTHQGSPRGARHAHSGGTVRPPRREPMPNTPALPDPCSIAAARAVARCVHAASALLVSVGARLPRFARWGFLRSGP